MSWIRSIPYVAMITVLFYSGEVRATTIVSGDLSIRDGGDLVFSDGSVQSKAQLQGPAGPATTMAMGTVSSGTTAGATITGVAPNQVLNLTLPLGPQGVSGSSLLTLPGICDAVRAGGAPLPLFCLSPAVTSITSPTVMYSKQSSFTVSGADLGNATVTAVGACSSLTEAAGGSATTRTFSCTPTSVGTVTIFVTSDGTALKQISFPVPPPQVTFVTSMGTIVVEFYPTNAPITVNNFLRYVNEGFYAGTIFHRVVTGFVVQGGGFGIDGVQKSPTHGAIALELPSATGLTNLQGTIAMARTTDVNSATTQFFFNTVNNSSLDAGSGGYAAFGSVIQGFDIVKAIEAVPVSATDSKPVTPVIVTSATQTR